MAHWSTDLSVPVIDRSFLSSTVTRWSVSVLKTEKMSYIMWLSACMLSYMFIVGIPWPEKE